MAVLYHHSEGAWEDILGVCLYFHDFTIEVHDFSWLFPPTEILSISMIGGGEEQLGYKVTLKRHNL